MTLHVHRAERADRLAVGLGALLSTPLEDPFAAEIVSVPTRGVERWLAQRLSHRLGADTGDDDGVCAGVEFPSPRRSDCPRDERGLEPHARGGSLAAGARGLAATGRDRGSRVAKSGSASSGHISVTIIVAAPRTAI